MKEIKDTLREIFCFEDMSEEMLEFIAGCGQNMSFAPNEFIAKENERADYLYIVRRGHVAVQVNRPAGPVTIRTLSNGEVAGFSWIVPPYRLQFDLKALDRTSVIALNGDCVRKKCEEDYKLGYLLMKQSAIIMNKRLFDTRIQLIDVYC